MNAEKLARLQSQVRIGGKGTPRRKKKTVYKTESTDEKKLQSALQKVRVNQIPGVEEVNLFKEDGNVMHFKNPRVHASLASNTFALYGQHDDKQLTELLPGIISQMGPEYMSHLGKLAGVEGLNPVDDKALDNSDDEVPDLVENFDEASKGEVIDVPVQEALADASEVVVSEEINDLEESNGDEAVLASEENVTATSGDIEQIITLDGCRLSANEDNIASSEMEDEGLDTKDHLVEQNGDAKEPDDEDEDADPEKERLAAERLEAYYEKKSKKPAPIAKTSVVLDIKPWDDETDMDEMLKAAKSIEKEGLVWGASKLVPEGPPGINKLQLLCVVEDEKVSIDELCEEIAEFEDYVQSVDVDNMSKI